MSHTRNHTVNRAIIGILALFTSLLAWDNWQMREALASAQTARIAAEAAASRAGNLALSSSCPPAAQSGQTATAPGAERSPSVATVPAIPAAKPDPVSNTVHIPPGTDLAEAIRIFQREQAKTQPGSAGLNPFGSNH